MSNWTWNAQRMEKWELINYLLISRNRSRFNQRLKRMSYHGLINSIEMLIALNDPNWG